MFDVLVYLYENYWRGDACPELPQLERKLSAIGFESDEIREALIWLDGLNLAAQSSLGQEEPAPEPTLVPNCLPQSVHSMRVYSVAEQNQLGAACLGFITFLESAGVLPPSMREVVIERAVAAAGGELMPLDDLKIIVLMVYWSFGEEPDALVLDELYDDPETRVAH
jgi:Smg protein